MVDKQVTAFVNRIVEQAQKDGPVVARDYQYDPRPTTPSILDRVEVRLMELTGGNVAPKGGSPEGFPVTHRFTPGLYIREIFMPAGGVIMSKIHMTEHPFTVSQGLCLVFKEGGGWEEIAAPHTGITYPGTRRLLFILRDTIWTTYHTTSLTDPAEIEDEILLDYQNPLLPEPRKELHS